MPVSKRPDNFLSPSNMPLNSRTYTQIHTLTVVQGDGGVGGGGGVMEPLPRVFNMLQSFETILPLVESLWSS